MTTSMSGATPPDEVRLASDAMKGSRTKPSLASQGAREVELPEMTSCRRALESQRGELAPRESANLP